MKSVAKKLHSSPSLRNIVKYDVLNQVGDKVFYEIFVHAHLLVLCNKFINR